MEERVGRYPFDIFGSLIVVADLGFALETQTISLLDSTWFTDYGQGVWDPTMLHELSHMWFGDSVAPYEWSDLWLNEGHASWYEFVYAEEKGFLAEDTTNYPDEQGYATLEELMRAVYAHGDQWRHDSGPVAKPSSGGRRPVQLQRLPRRRARPVRPAPEDRQVRVRARRAGVGHALSGQVGQHGRLHRAGRRGVRTAT